MSLQLPARPTLKEPGARQVEFTILGIFAGMSSTREAPPLSLTRCWDKAKWHADAANFPAGLPRSAGGEHILAALRFLAERDMLTAEGKQELAGKSGDDLALLAEHVRAPARAFLDSVYQRYLELQDYGHEPPTAILHDEWASYAVRFDLSRRSRPTPWQALLARAPGTSDVEGVLQQVRHNDAHVDAIEAAIEHAPPDERALAALVVSLHRADVGDVARSTGEPALCLRALRFLTRERRPGALRAAACLAGRLGNATNLAHLAWAVNLFVGDDLEDAEWSRLAPSERRELTERVNRLLLEGPERYLALNALRVVGDRTTLALLDKLPPRLPDEGEQRLPNGTWEPVSKGTRVHVRARIERRGG